MNIKITLMTILVLISSIYTSAQNDNVKKDSLYIQEIEDHLEPDKVLHAEPLYIDLLRDLGARKGEKEWNIGFGLTDNLEFSSYEVLVEYEWAPINRLGLEVEIPLTFYSPLNGVPEDSIPSDEVSNLKAGVQWSFFVNKRLATSMALGYLHEFEVLGIRDFGEPFIIENIYNPLFIVAKRWGNNFHTLIYTGPMIEKNRQTNDIHTVYEINTSIHHMISGTKNFIGIEFNKSFDKDDFDMTMRPQIRIDIRDDLLIGMVAGIPVERENERLSVFFRLIWEPVDKGN